MSTTPVHPTVHPLQRHGYGQGRSFPSKHLDFRTRGISGPGNNRSRRSALLDTPNFWRDLDLSQVLGDNETYGHTGCVNALSWSHDGSQLLSGSDDARLCIWEPDETTAPTTETPHPFRLKESIQTAHRANIFSAKFLPQAGHPTIASVAGDSRVMVYDVERLARSTHLMNELDGRSGPGVREIMCHTDRVKRISTEDNPHVFLTVSEDGTVRQHDLRTTHQCRTGPARGSNCPVPLLEAPGGIELYTLSVSKLNPYLFTVAGTSAYAYLQDRRMTKQIAEEWSHRVDPGSQVQCVRRFGLPPASEKGPGEAKRGRWSSPRHITAVRMSPDVAEDLIVSFSGHGVALYSIHDTPGEITNDVNTRSSPSHRKRIQSRHSIDNEDVTEERNSDALSIDMQPTSATTNDMDTDVVSSQVDPKDMDLAYRLAHHQYQSRDFLLSPEHAGGNASSILSPSGQGLEGVLDMDMPSESPDSESDDDEWDVDDDEEQDTAHQNESSDQSGWAGTPVVYPRCVYKGARNIETVKDVSFGGARSDKICSGSDDGNWFMWDKITGRLEGIWEGDESVVNVVEQHPSLPIFAVSGIDSTVKVFSPLHDHHGVSKGRIHHADEIIARNKLPEPSPVGFSMHQYRMLIESRLARQLGEDEDGTDEEGPCQVQ